MHSELARLAELLRSATDDGTAPTARELAEVLWLARQLTGPESSSIEPPPQQTPEPPLRAPAHPSPADVPPPPPPVPSAPPGPPHPHPNPEPDRVPLYVDPSPQPTAASLLAPTPPMLRHPLALQRALRPLKRRVPARTGRPVLDEAATANRIARLGAAHDMWLPVLHPAPERWLRLALIHDTGPTMPVWRPLLRELHTALTQSGIFRTITVHPATPDGRVPHLALPRDGRTAVLLLSDGTGPQWHRGPAGTRWYRTLHTLASHTPLALLQPLPEHLWRTTALPTAPGRFTAPHPAAPLPALRFTPYDAEDALPHGALPLPVLETSAPWLANWSRLVGAPGGAQVPGTAAWLRPHPTPPAEAGPLPRTPEDLVRAFRATASPEAYRLAGHLAVGVPHLPVMRLVHAALEPDPRPQHLAEVILSGLLTTASGPPGSYAFRAGVRDLLLRSLPRTSRTRTHAFLARVGGLIDERVGAAAGEFRASTRGAEGEEAFAAVRVESVRRMAGAGTRALPDRYRLGRRLRGGMVRMAHDLRLDRPVLVKLHAAPDRDAFLRDARVLAGIDHPGVARLLDFGFTEDGDPYTVVEHLEGIPLDSLVPSDAYRLHQLPGDLLGRITQSLAHALTTVHEAGCAHGRIGLPRVMLLPDGTVKLSLFEPGLLRRAAGRADDCAKLHSLLVELGAPLGNELIAPDAPTRTNALSRLARDVPPLPRSSRYAYELLGRVQVTRTTPDGRTRLLDDFSPDEQALLCMLLLKPGLPVPMAELAQGIRGDAAPGATTPSVEDTALGLRLRPDAFGLATLPDAYALHTSTDTVDAIRLQTHVTEAERDRAAGDLQSARNHLSVALSLYRGTPLDGVPGPAAATARTRLTQLRLALLGQRAELDLDLGEPERAAEALAGLVREHPSREDFRRLQMIALRQLGRIDEALESFEDYEGYLAENGRVGAVLTELRRDLMAARDVAAGHTIVLFESPGGATPELGHQLDRLMLMAQLTPHSPRPAPHPHGYEIQLSTADATVRLLTATVTELPPDAHLSAVFWPAGPGRRAERDAVGEELVGTGALSQVAAHPAIIDRGTATSLGLHTRRVDATSSYWYRSLTRFTQDDRDHVVAALGALPAMADFDTRDRLAGELSTQLDRRVHVPGDDAEADLRILASVALSSADGERALIDTVAIVLGPDAAEECERRLGHVEADPLQEPLIRGPLPMPSESTAPTALDDRTALVYRHPSGSLGLDPPDESDLLWEYYEVDLTEREIPVEEGVLTRVQVSDPVQAVQNASLDLASTLAERLETEAARLPSPLDVEKVLRRLNRWPVPGYVVRWELSSPSALVRARTRPDTDTRADSGDRLTRALATAESYLLAFDGPLVQLYARARDAARELTALATELRDPDDALTGVPLEEPLELDIHPLDVLRTFARTPRLARTLRARLDEIELRALRTARPTRDADLLVRTLNSTGRPVSVVSDVSPHVISAYLASRSPAVRAGVHGRSADPALLMPHPDALHRALHRPGSPTPHGVLIGSSPAELLAARAIGLPFIGYAASAKHASTLTGLGARLVVRDLSQLVDAVRGSAS
ncbi:hypothetical protein GTY65_15830 [Streptomyces sp. SID8379]|uniref:SAV_2336 N-terminal domain-related protein n=1 Tax=unclassified Streptomyces TaxID=2593676 RepID=UPI0003A03F31|nr:MULTISPECIES: SAV_2336 N-terminal domain-related protein [unclassified Streptomyces]MYW65518.1 hypothetical protein [Streptomyces sp. SID8379]